jgi:hypothetical protein
LQKNKEVIDKESISPGMPLYFRAAERTSRQQGAIFEVDSGQRGDRLDLVRYGGRLSRAVEMAIMAEGETLIAEFSYSMFGTMLREIPKGRTGITLGYYECH